MNSARTLRNEHGLKDSIDCYRTIDGVRYYAWLSNPSSSRVTAYRAVGVRCVRRGVELFVHNLDTDTAAEVDSKAEGN